MMFTDENYIAYFEEIEQVLNKTMVIYTDLLSEIGDYSMKSKLYSNSLEGIKIIRSLRVHKKLFEDFYNGSEFPDSS